MDYPMPYDADLERRIRERAFQIWLEEGQPLGRDKEHWLIAETELVSGPSPPLQPDQQSSGVQQAPSVVGGINPDDVTR